MRRLPARAASAGLLTLGAALLAEGLWIPAKAAVAQHLLERAFARRARGEAEARPWPWADFVPLARLRVPRLEASMVVLSGATGGTLAFGPGHLAGSAPPGAGGNVVIAGHRDTHFAFLGRLAPGDALVLETPEGGRRRYRMREANVVDERALAALAPTRRPTLTLVTCWPLGARAAGGRLRLVVVAEEAAATAPAEAAPTAPAAPRAGPRSRASPARG